MLEFKLLSQIMSTNATALVREGSSSPVLERSKLLTPPLKWAGGKRWQLPYILPYWENEQRRRLVEPFCGGLAVSLGLLPKRSLLNDINPHLINFYRWLRKGLVIELDLVNNEPDFYRNRERFNKLLHTGKGNSKEAASLFYYLNRTCYNGLCRFNSRGEFNVPFGKYDNITYRYDFSIYRTIFEDWGFTNVAFNEIQLKPTDFVYADPPYDVQFRQYSKGGFSWEEQVQTAEWLSEHPGPVMLSNQATARIRELYLDYGFAIIELDGPRRISCTGDRSPAREVLAVRNLRLLPHQRFPFNLTSGGVGKVGAKPRRHAELGRELMMTDPSSKENARAWLAANGYEDYGALIDEVTAEWKAKGSKERKNWWLIMSGDSKGQPRKISHRVFPVLAAFQERQGKIVTENAERRNPNEVTPKIQKQARWAGKRRRKRKQIV